MATKRTERLAEAYHRELSELILKDLRDPRLTGVYLTRVVFTPDLRLAKVYFNISGGRVREKEAVKGFEHSSGFLRKELANRVRVKFAPELKFYYDESQEVKDQIDDLFLQLEAERNEKST